MTPQQVAQSIADMLKNRKDLNESISIISNLKNGCSGTHICTISGYTGFFIPREKFVELADFMLATHKKSLEDIDLKLSAIGALMGAKNHVV